MDYKHALMVFYVVMMSSYFDKFFSCDLQRLLSSNIIAKHIVAITSVFFVITLVSSPDTKNEEDPEKRVTFLDYIKYTLIIYLIYIASTKSKLYFVLPMLGLLTVDQLLDVYAKTDLKYADKTEATVVFVTRVRSTLSVVVALLIVGGITHYTVRAVMEFKGDFDIFKLLMGTYKCTGI